MLVPDISGFLSAVKPAFLAFPVCNILKNDYDQEHRQYEEQTEYNKMIQAESSFAILFCCVPAHAACIYRYDI